MRRDYYNRLADLALEKKLLPRTQALEILESAEIETLPLVNAAYEVRKHFVGTDISIHIINNGQNGLCPEDCHYCAQAKSSEAEIDEYPLKSDEEFLAEARNAWEKGAHRYCMVFAGRGPSAGRVDRLARLIQTIKARYPLEVCVSPGLLDETKARVLKAAGLDRLNHNLNTSRRNYPNICTTHTFEDRIETLKAARRAGLQVCSGLIMGMNETAADIIDIAYELRELKAESIPVNMLIPIPGNKLQDARQLTPDFCLRALCLFRFLNPWAEIRVAAGREIHLRQMEVLAFYPANSLFLDGYLNTKGDESGRTLRMIQDAGFTIKSEHDLSDLLQNGEDSAVSPQLPDRASQTVLKTIRDLRPHHRTCADPVT